MADNEEGEENVSRGNECEEGEENVSRGNDWVLLTDSTYTPAPGPEDFEVKDNRDDAYLEDEGETSRALFMSGHFVFPPNQHENLPLESDILEEQVRKNFVPELNVQKGDKSGGKDDNILGLEQFDPEEYPGMIPIYRTEFEGSSSLPEKILNDKEQSIYSAAAAFSSLHSETELGGSATYEDMGMHEASEQPEQGVDLSTDISSHSPKSAKDSPCDDSDLPCEAWWKRRAVSLYAHAKEMNAFWSVFVAAAVMGLVIIGQRWQQERWRALQLKWHASINEKSGRMLAPISRLKDVIVGGHRRGSYIRGINSNENQR